MRNLCIGLVIAICVSGCETVPSQTTLQTTSTGLPSQQSYTDLKRKNDSRHAEVIPFDQEDLQWLYKTTYGEVRQQGDTEVKAVCQVIYNRLQSGLWGTSFRDVVLADKQFSVWNKYGGQRRLLHSGSYYSDPNYIRVVDICNSVLVERVRGVDHSRGINYFYHPNGMEPKCVKYKKFKKRRHSHFRCTRWRKLPPTWAYNYEYKTRIGAGVFFAKGYR